MLMSTTEGQQAQDAIAKARDRYLRFLDLCVTADGAHRLTPESDPSSFATCFWIFGMHLLRKDDILFDQRSTLSESIRRTVRQVRVESAAKGQLYAKPYRQLLAFSLSALSVLGVLEDDPLEELVIDQLPHSVEHELEKLECLSGKAQSGNHAMFMAIFLLHARDRLGLPVGDKVEAWIRCHLASMNKFGFWGSKRSMTALQFQNGYHQYEIFEYLSVRTGKAETTADFVARLADSQGHFAPYPGGGGCFDYDAIFMLTPDGGLPNQAIAELLKRTSATLLSEQQADGGFCESLYVRPRSQMNAIRSVHHVLDALPNMAAAMERLRNALALQRRKYDRIQTHWSTYSRRWDESDLWDSWFRMLALARIECAINDKAFANWGYIDFPGIGFHPALRGIGRAKT